VSEIALLHLYRVSIITGTQRRRVCAWVNARQSGGYHISDINFVAAFDIDKNKVGLDLADAIYAKPNNTIVFDKVPSPVSPLTAA